MIDMPLNQPLKIANNYSAMLDYYLINIRRIAQEARFRSEYLIPVSHLFTNKTIPSCDIIQHKSDIHVYENDKK